MDVLFVPGGTYAGSFRPFVTMSRNLLPFDLPERRRYDGSLVGLRLRALSISQARTFRRAAGVIFLTDTAKAIVTARTGHLAGRTAVIPHGIAGPFFAAPRVQRDLSAYEPAAPFKWIYVSIVDLYKHQARVAEAVAILRGRGLPVSIDFIGPAYPPALKELQTALARIDPASEFVRYRGPIPYTDLPAAYQSADGAVFASSCENMPNILLESMASGLPIACSNRSVMPEVLGDAGVYFDPESASDIAAALETLFRDTDLRARSAAKAYERASRYSWERCAQQTFDFIARVTAPGGCNQANSALT
ncbi:MAG TPA: glycosyltransferase family 1 protein [Polyangiaceae bacterium]|nr:glycosyltransferase family 1 protein [Polyangiaceae bacterium]